jgi:hypothetical protein
MKRMKVTEPHTQGYALIEGGYNTGEWTVKYFDDRDHHFFVEAFPIDQFSEDEVQVLVEDWASGRRVLGE